MKKQLSPSVWGYFWILYSVPLIHVSVPLPIPHCLDYCSCIISLKFVWMFPLTLFLCQDSFSYSRSFVFSHKVQINLAYIYKVSCRDFDGNCIKSVYQFGDIWQLYYVLPIYEYRISFYLNLLWYLLSVFCNIKHTISTRFVWFTPKVFRVAVSGIRFLISVSTCAFLVCRSTLHFWMLILYPVTMVNLLISKLGVYL